MVARGLKRTARVVPPEFRIVAGHSFNNGLPVEFKDLQLWCNLDRWRTLPDVRQTLGDLHWHKHRS